MNAHKLILITGGTGWLGSNLLDSLLAKHKGCPDSFLTDSRTIIRCLVNSDECYQKLKQYSCRIQVIKGSITNPQDCLRLCEGANDAILIHIAGIVHPKVISEFFSINTLGTKNVIEAASQAKLKRFIYISSNSPFGCNASNKIVFNESSSYNPYMNYGRSKMNAELIIKEYFKSGKIETVILNPPWFYGIYQPPRQTLFFNMIRSGKFPIIGNGENKRSMVYLENLCQAIHLSVITPHIAGHSFWISDEVPYTMNQIIATVKSLFIDEFGLTVSNRQLKLPSIISDIALFCDWIIQKAGRYHQKIHVLSEMNKTISCSIEKAKKELGYAPIYDLENGMKKSMLWCRDHRYLEF